MSLNSNQTTETTPPIRILNLCKSYPAGKHSQGCIVLNEITLTVKMSSISGIIGRSGAGKTTLLRCVNLLERPDSGQLYLDGIEVTSATQSEINRVRSTIGFIPQSFNLLTRRTVEGNIQLPLQVAHWNREETEARVRELSKLVGLTDKLSHYPSQLSGGQKQRVAIARALAARPKILLCDEFTSALDPETTDEILNLLKEINRELGVTVLLISHDMSVVQKVCDHVFVLQEGRIVNQGPATQVLKALGTATSNGGSLL